MWDGKMFDRWKRKSNEMCLLLQIPCTTSFYDSDTYCLYFSSDDFSRNGMPDKNKMIIVVNNGDRMAIHSIPRMTLSDITKMPHQIKISPK